MGHDGQWAIEWVSIVRGVPQNEWLIMGHTTKKHGWFGGRPILGSQPCYCHRIGLKKFGHIMVSLRATWAKRGFEQSKHCRENAWGNVRVDRVDAYVDTFFTHDIHNVVTLPHLKFHASIVFVGFSKRRVYNLHLSKCGSEGAKVPIFPLKWEPRSYYGFPTNIIVIQSTYQK